MARSDTGIAPQKRGLFFAVSLGCGLILSAILLLKQPSHAETKKGDAEDDSPAASTSSVWERIGFDKHKSTSTTVAKMADPNALKLDNIDKQTQQHQAKGAIV